MEESPASELARKIVREHPDVSPEDAHAKALKIAELSASLRRMYETECSYPIGETPEFKARVKRLEERIDLLMKSINLNYKFQTDPRGTAVRIFFTYETPAPFNTMGGPEAGWGI